MEVGATLELGAFVFGVSLWAVLLWGSIRLLEPGNGNNSFGKALALGVLYGVACWFVGHMALIGLFFAVAWLVFVLRLLTDWYELGILKSLGVTAAINIGPYYLIPKMFGAVGNNVYLLLFGFPAVVLVVWLVHRRGVSMPTLPFARASSRKASKVAMTTNDAPVVDAAAPVASVAATPVAPVYKPIAPAAPLPPPGDKPRLLT